MNYIKNTSPILDATDELDVLRRLPEFLKNGMGIALYAMFIGLLTPSLRKSRSVLIVASVAAIVNSFLHWTALLTAGWNIIISTIIASAIGSFLFRREEI